MKYIGAIDQGTTSTRFVIFNKEGAVLSTAQKTHRQIFPQPGWVEHDPMEIRDNTFGVISEAMEKLGCHAGELAALGITNQRETTLLWDRETGTPYYNAIVWQDTRTRDHCRRLISDGRGPMFREKTGLPISTYFSGPKICWMLENVKGLCRAIEQGRVLFGTIDTWLIWWLTGGIEGGRHLTDVTNASRTMLMDLKTLQWDDSLAGTLGIPKSILPEIRSSSEIYAECKGLSSLQGRVPLAGVLGDQQAALFGQACFEKGEAKNTYGTGCFMLLNTGERPVISENGLLTTVAFKTENSPACYALEGSVAIAGSLVQWIRDNLGLVEQSADIEALAASVEDNGGVYFVPAFSGLFAPHWRDDARGVIAGLTHFACKGHIARAVLEATAFQTMEIVEVMKQEAGLSLNALKVDGGMVANEVLMQFQADILDTPVVRPKMTETTVLGAAFAAGLAVGFWSSKAELKVHWSEDRKWLPSLDASRRKALSDSWKKAVEKSLGWA